MNCNDAFDRLTDPELCDDPSLQFHLRQCPRCRQMQATLSPALNWLKEERTELSLPFESGSEGSQQPFLTAQAVKIADQLARDLPRRQNRLQLGPLMSMVAVALLGVSIGAFGGTERPAGALVPGVSQASMLSACLWESPVLRQEWQDRTARSVVVSCVNCHVPASTEADVLTN